MRFIRTSWLRSIICSLAAILLVLGITAPVLPFQSNDLTSGASGGQDSPLPGGARFESAAVESPLAVDESAPSPERSAAAPAIEGWVREASSGANIGGATISLEGVEGVPSTKADATGYFRIGEIKFSSDQVKKIILSVSAEGYGTWTLGDAVYYPHDTLRVYPRLAAGDSVAEVYGAGRQAREANAGLVAQNRAEHASVYKSILVSPSAAPPATVRVYRTQTGVVEVVPFREYVKHTLPNEWIPSWSPAALKAGAMAVKTYAWYWIAQGGKQVALGADLKDNIEDQVYDPNVSYASTDAAVDATFNYAMTRNGSVFQAQYCAGSYIPDPTGDCPWSGPFMTQWGSAYYADQGKSWGWILGFYYSGASISPAPPGGVYDGSGPAPGPTKAVPPTAPPTPPQPVYVVGQGSNQPEVFQEAYERNGGEAALGKPIGAVRWWMTYVSEFNVLAQQYAGPAGRGDTWIVYDVLKSGSAAQPRAFVVSGEIALAYKAHTPPGPEGVGAPTSDPYVATAAAGGQPSQGFTKGTLSWNGQSVQFTPWPTAFSDWKAEYFVGYQGYRSYPGLAPSLDLPGQPALVANAVSPSFDWRGEWKMPQQMGTGTGAWSVQFTRKLNAGGETYDFTLAANSGARLWVDGMLAVNGWNWSEGGSEKYSADLSPGAHTIRVQYFNSASRDARLTLDYAPRATITSTPTPASPIPPAANDGKALEAAVRVRVTWLGRQPGTDSWVQPITLYLSDPRSAAVLYSFAGKTDRNGVAIFQGLPSGRFNVHVKGAHSLQSARANVTLSDKDVVELDMKVQVEGDADGDNCVTVDDLSIVQAMLGANKSTPGFNAAADLNGDGAVTMSDVSLLRSGFDRCGDISADDFSVMTADASPNLSQALLPWTQPDRLDHNLGLELAASKTTARRGDIVEVQVIANTGQQPVDGVSFLLRYDPAKLKALDASGNDASGSEPGFALPGVMGNWLDPKGGLAGYSAGMLQGETAQGRFVVATLRFRVVAGNAGSTRLAFAPVSAVNMEIANGGVDLLARASDLELALTP